MELGLFMEWFLQVADRVDLPTRKVAQQLVQHNQRQELLQPFLIQALPV
jgi:hypothetical protein